MQVTFIVLCLCHAVYTVAMSCELDAFESFFMTFPVCSDGDDSTELKYENNVPVMILLGWTGCQQRHLKKYSAIYEKK